MIRYISHGLVVILVVICAVGSAVSLTPVERVNADNDSKPPPVERLLSGSAPTDDAQDRSGTSTRSESIPQPTPLPTPVALDPSATPLAPPLQPALPAQTTVTPVTHAPALPVAVPVVHDGIWPVVGGGISQYFSYAHPAVDIYANCFSPILASYGGVVTYSGWKNNGGGNVVAIITDSGLLMEYNHLNSTAVIVGSYVPAGSVVGYVGATGIATGCHVHIAISVNGLWVDPLAYL